MPYWKEPQVPARKTFIKPDLLIQVGTNLLVGDVQICGDSNSSTAFREKVAKYTPFNLELLRFASSALRWSCDSVIHAPFILTFRGLLHSSSIVLWKSAVSLSDVDLSDCCVCALTGSARAAELFLRGT